MRILASITLLLALPAISAFAPAPRKKTQLSSPSVLPLSLSSNVELVGAVDEDALLSSSTFPIAPADLINRVKQVLNPDVQLGMADGGECLAEDFEFVAAVVGPIGRKEYLGALKNFDLAGSFDVTPNFFGFSVDPLQPNRVYFFNRNVAEQTATFMGAEVPEGGRTLELPPQCYHIDFDESGKIREFGFYTVDRRQGNTGGLGGAFAFLYGVGKPLPIPECQPYKRSFRFRMLSFVGGLAQKLSKKNT